ncbi:MAG: UDP-N-acetylmuramate--L-alanine ligase [Phycisphaeraceae bacterium]|nr:MAG: UDP-N-acetylmuramate--L-alanine ligase [Phycisphaeraceae bacterium]
MALGLDRPYLIGIGGCGMSALARLLAADGARVSGSDSTSSPVTDTLLGERVRVDFDQTAANLPEDADGVVASAAIKPDHPQLLEAQQRGLPVYTYAEALGRSMAGRTGVSIAGTHGKSTTTAMLGCVLTDAGLDPGVIVGATCGQLGTGCLAERSPERGGATGFRMGSPQIPSGTLAGQPGLLLAEACEFNRSFHHHRPVVGSIANLEADHLDIYGSLDAVIEAFAGFAALLPDESKGGRLLIGHDGAHRREITAGLKCKVETIGFAPAADWVVRTDVADRTVSLDGPGGVHAEWTNLMPGEHNAMNSAVAAALAIGLGADPAIVGRSLSAFRGLDRRLQFLGERVVPGGGSVRVYDDYGHHPTEIDATLRSLRQAERVGQGGAGRLVCVFQPHQHSRTRFLLEEFATSFEHADVVIVPHIYFVRDSEAEKHKVSAADLVDRLRSRGVRAMHLYPFGAIVEHLENVCRPGDLLVVMGAGPVWQVARDYLKGS